MLRDAVASGILPFEELEGRIDAVYAAPSVDDLERLVRWLPTPDPLRARGAARERTGPRRVRVWLAIATVLAAVAVGAFLARSDEEPGRAARDGPIAASPTAAVPTSPPPTATSTSPRSARPTSAESAVIAVDTSRHLVTVEVGLQNVTYPTCRQFDAVGSDGREAGIADLRAGDFAALNIDDAVPCLAAARVLTPPAPPECTATGSPGVGDVTWIGANEAAHSVLYSPSGSSSVYAARWCERPTVVAPDGTAMRMSQISSGQTVQLRFAGNEWLQAVTLRQS